MNVIILSTHDLSLGLPDIAGYDLPASFTSHIVYSLQELEVEAHEFKTRHVKFSVMNSCAKAVLFALQCGASVCNKKGEAMYFISSQRQGEGEVNSTFYTKPEMQIRAVIESACNTRDAEQASWRVNRMLNAGLDFFGDETLRCILQEGINSPKILAVFQKSYAKFVSDYEAKVNRIIKPSTPEIVDLKTFRPTGASVLSFEMGSGKSVLMNNEFDSARNDGRFPMMLVPNIALTGPHASRDEHYKNTVDTDGREIIKKGAISTLNSAKISGHSRINSEGNLLIIDEAVRGFEHINGDAFFDGTVADKRSGFKYIFDRIKSCEDVTISDAHFGQEYIDILEGITGKKFTAYKDEGGRYNNIKFNFGTLKSEDLIHKAKNDFRNNESITFFSDRKQEIAKSMYCELADFTQAKGGKSILLNAHEMNVDESIASQAASDPSNVLKDYNLIFCTPAVGPGFSAVLPEVKKIYIDCCGTISPLSLIQTCLRFRNVEEIYISFSLNNRKAALPETRSDVCYSLIERENEVNLSEGDTILSHNTTLHNKMMADPILCAAFDFLAIENWTRNSYKNFVITAMKQLGFALKFISTDEDNVAMQSSKLAARKTAEAEFKRKLYQSVEMISAKEVKFLENKTKAGLVDLNTQYLIEKASNALIMGVNDTFSDIDYDFVCRKGVVLINRIRLANGKPGFERTTAERMQAQVLRDIQNFLTIGEFTQESFSCFVSHMKVTKGIYEGKNISQIKLLKNYFMLIVDAKDNYKAVNSMIGLLGFKLRSDKNKKTGRGADRKNAYVLDTSFRDQADAYIQRGNRYDDYSMIAYEISSDPLQENDEEAMIHQVQKCGALKFEGVPA
ncbi:hypothetical protein [Pseudomonas sp. LT1P18]|uniref:hypothetical protein n=1 Tax=Pseudomonas arabinosi TaxID=3398357 RepID=UPI0039F07CAD